MDNSYHIKNIQKYVCETCDFKCCKHSDWIRHIDTRKHSKETIGDPILHQNKQFFCNICNKEYKSKNGLWKHKKSCNIKEEEAKEKCKDSYAIHVFETYWRDVVKNIDEQWIKKYDCLFSELARL